MNMFSPAEAAAGYVETGVKKASRSVLKQLVLSAAAGMVVALACAATSTAAHTNGDIASVKVITGLLFPFALITIILMGLELFTGSCLAVIPALDRKLKAGSLFRYMGIVYAGNLVGALLVAVVMAYSGQFDYSAGVLGVYTIKVAAAKCGMSFPAAFAMGVFCNVLVCAAIMCASAAKDAAGKALGAYGPVALFVFIGLEHSVANMYYIPAGLFAKNIPAYAAQAAELGINMSNLTWGAFAVNNLLPVTLGNIVGGFAVGAFMWYGHKSAAKSH